MVAISRPAGAGLGERLDRWSGKQSILIRDRVSIGAERAGQLDPQSLAVQSVGVFVGSPSSIAGKLPLALCPQVECP